MFISEDQKQPRFSKYSGLSSNYTVRIDVYAYGDNVLDTPRRSFIVPRYTDDTGVSYDSRVTRTIAKFNQSQRNYRAFFGGYVDEN